jgi:hypothetical protein
MKKKFVCSIFMVIFASFGLGVGCTKNSSSNVDKIMNADKNFQFPPGFPPDPGEAGKKTLEGIDSDHDGLRDDLQRWIYARFPNEPKKRNALKQMTMSFQSDLKLKNDREALKLASKRSSKAIVCLHEVFGSDNSEMKLIRAKFLNTRERSEQYLRTDQWFDGMTLGPSYPVDGTACEN